MTTTPAPSLAGMPGMDDIKIGPGGQTFGQLKADVLSTRQAFMAALMRGEADNEVAEAHHTAVSLLEAAYVRVGLPYVAP